MLNPNSEDSLARLQEMRRQVVMIKGEAVEGLPPVIKEEAKNFPSGQPFVKIHEMD